MSRTFFLGVDGGGTKTQYVLIDRDGNLAAAHEGPAAYHIEIGIDGLRRVLADGIMALFGKAAIDGNAVSHAFFGLPAYGEDSAAQLLLDVSHLSPLSA